MIDIPTSSSNDYIMNKKRGKSEFELWRMEWILYKRKMICKIYCY